MPAKKYNVELDASERERLTTLISKGKAAAKSILKARILLKADQGESGTAWPDAQIVEAFETPPSAARLSIMQGSCVISPVSTSQWWRKSCSCRTI